MPVLLLLLLLPVAELWFLIHIGSEIGALATIILLILASAAGMALLRIQGDYAIWKAQERLQRGDLPLETVFDGLLLALAGLLLIIPGFLTDIAALPLLLPPLRHWLARQWLPSVYQAQTTYQTQTSRTRDGHHIIEGEFQREDTDRLV